MKEKKTILILILIMLFISILLLIIMNKYKQKESEKNMDESNIEINYEYKKIENYTMFFTVSNCVQKYFDFISLNLDNNLSAADYKTKQQELNISTETEKKQAIYDILDKEYIKNNNIDLNNIYGFVHTLSSEAKFIPVDMNMLDGDRIQRFCVYGTINNKDIYLIVNLDCYNFTYTIEPLLTNTNINEIKLDSKNYEIEKNDNNKYSYIRLKDADIAREYMMNYRTNLINNIDKAYESLDKEYRDKRFGNIEEFKKYVSNNKSKIINSAMKEYSVSEKEGYTQYIAIDTNGNYYIFKVTGIMEYTVLTDFYTIELEEIANNYDNSNVQERVAINIQKVVAALNNKDYKYVYGKLAEEFKVNKYPTLQAFESAMSSISNENTDITWGEFNNEGETYIYNITLKNAKNSSIKPVNMQIIMQLKQNRDFVMSFNIK